MINLQKKIKKLGAGIMAGLCAISVISNSIASSDFSADATSSINTENTAFPTADEVIAQAATLLGSPYGWGFKGYTGVYYKDSYNPLSLDYVRNQGVDCSGLIYYTLTHLGYSTNGFSWNNPVPVDTTHWLSVNGSCTISRNGVTSDIDVEKADIPYTERPYWECTDGTTITPGSMVIADNLAGEDHSWIYMGEFDSRDEVIKYLRNIGLVSCISLVRMVLNVMCHKQYNGLSNPQRTVMSTHSSFLITWNRGKLLHSSQPSSDCLSA